MHNHSVDNLPSSSSQKLQLDKLHKHAHHHFSSPDTVTGQATPTPTEFSRLQLIYLTSGLIGLQFCWAVQVGYVTKSLLELGLPQRFVSYAWLAGPIAGIVVQPIVGILSDRCTSPLGRRRPFLVGGSFLAALCLLAFAYAKPLGIVFLGGQNGALIIAITSFWALDFSINAAQGPLRALLADVVPPHQHNQGNAYFALATGLGNFSGSMLGSLPLSKALWFFKSDLEALYSIAVVVLLCTMGLTIVFTKEVPLVLGNNSDYDNERMTLSTYDSVQHDNNNLDLEQQQSIRTTTTTATTNNTDDTNTITTTEDLNASASATSFVDAARTAPHPFWPLFLIQCFSWFAWFTLFVFGTSWVGSEVVHGSFSAAENSPARERYDAGVRLGNLGLALQSILTIVMSPSLPSLISKFGAQRIYLVASVTLAMALGSSLVIRSAVLIWAAVLAIASTGFAWTVTMTIPWSLMGEAVAKEQPKKAGIYYTMFNLSQCIPEVIVSLVAEEVERVTKSQMAVLVLGAMSVLVAAGLIVVLGVGKKEDDSLGEIDSDDEVRMLGVDERSRSRRTTGTDMEMAS